VIEQPGFNIEAFQETPIFARVTGYVEKWNADIGEQVTPKTILVELSVPDLKMELKQKEAAVAQAEAQVKQARAAIAAARAQVARTQSQYQRLSRVAQGGLVDRESVEEVRLGYEAAQAGMDRANADVTAAEAHVEVARANRDHARTMLDFARIPAPFDGVVTARNLSVGDLVQPGGTVKGQPLYVVQQIDPVRVFVNVPGVDAAWIKNGDRVIFRVQGAGGEAYEGRVTRNARALNPQSRTLRTEIDVPNPKGTLLPGMYVQAAITVQHPNVWTLPAAAVRTEGDQTICFQVADGKEVRTPLQVGLRGDGQVEVLKKLARSASGEEKWEDITGEEEVALPR
jgi:RND family efflux transporter MFP subunit